MQTKVDEEIVFQGPGSALKHKDYYQEPVKDYMFIQCLKEDGCEGCPLTCAPKCDRWPDHVCFGCPCLTIDEKAIEGVFGNP